jgi:hypothetical protein
MLNPSLRQEPRYEPAAVIPVNRNTSILDWLSASGRLVPRDKEKEEILSTDLLDEDVELSELMDVDDSLYDDDDDGDIEIVDED